MMSVGNWDRVVQKNTQDMCRRHLLNQERGSPDERFLDGKGHPLFETMTTCKTNLGKFSRKIKWL